MIALTSFKLVEFFGETDPIEYMTIAKQSMEENLDLESLGFAFAIENLDAAYGRVVVEQVSWSGTDGEKSETELKMGLCTNLVVLNQQLPVNTEFSTVRNDQNAEYLCPLQGQDLKVAGSYHDRLFSYIKLSVKSCDESIVTKCHDY